MSENTETDTIKWLADLAANPIAVAEGGAPIVRVPTGVGLESLEQFMPAPLRIKRNLRVKTVESFVRYFNEFYEDASRIYADGDTVMIRGVLDDHTDRDGPQWCDHSVTYSCPYSREWLAWTKNDRKKCSQVDFAEWLEDHTADIVEPIGTDLLNLCNQLQIHRKATYGSSQRLASGEHSFSYSEENQSGTVEIPSMIKLGVPVFVDGAVYAVDARFKYRLEEGRLVLWYELVNPQKYVEDAFAAILDQIRSETEALPIAAEVTKLA